VINTGNNRAWPMSELMVERHSRRYRGVHRRPSQAARWRRELIADVRVGILALAPAFTRTER
jgi:hypothetical protein